MGLIPVSRDRVSLESYVILPSPKLCFHSYIFTLKILFSNETRCNSPGLIFAVPSISMTVIEDPEPLKHEYVPEEVIGRKSELENLDSSQNLHLHGPRGTGKTLLARKLLEELDGQKCFISCLEHNTQYKILQELMAQLSEDIGTGYHTSELQRKFEEHTEVLDVTVVLDELDLLLLNDGDDLLYFLSRLDTLSKIITVSANTTELRENLEPRTYSTLRPRRIHCEPYTGEEIYRMITDRASKSLEKRSLHRNAATYIASKTQNAELAITWLKQAAEDADQAITEQTVQNTKEEAFTAYVERRLEKLTQHHRQIYRIIQESGRDSTVNTGELYRRYQEISDEQGLETVSNRRISDYLKQLEQLNLVESEYHYGGPKGKTREIRFNHPL